MKRTPTRSPQPLAAIVTVACITFALACSEADPPAPAEPEAPPNFVVIVADTLRADRVDGSYDRPGITPHLDALRTKGSYFANAMTTSSWTLPSTVSLFVSQLPSHHGVTSWTGRLGDELTLLPEILQRAGYRTGGWSANRLITRERGFRRGFDQFELIYHPKWKGGMPSDSPYSFARGGDLLEPALAWLDETAAAPSKPFFLYLHMMEPHTPYMCSPPAGPACKKTARALNRSILSSVWLFDDKQKAFIEHFYDSDVSALDRAVGELVAALSERGLLDDTWIVFTADHGEMLGEHGLYLHGRALYQETVHIPLLLLPPGGSARVIETPVSIVDVAPTILAAAGVPRPDAFTGRSLLPAVGGAPLPEQPVAMELLAVNEEEDTRHRHLAAVRSGDTKFFVTTSEQAERVDLPADPHETAPGPAPMTEIDAFLGEAGSRLRASQRTDPESTELTPEEREHLKGLGYLQE